MNNTFGAWASQYASFPKKCVLYNGVEIIWCHFGVLIVMRTVIRNNRTGLPRCTSFARNDNGDEGPRYHGMTFFCVGIIFQAPVPACAGMTKVIRWRYFF